MKKRIQKLISLLTEGLHERNDIIAITLLATLAGEHSFLYGPPGTAKSLISRRLAHCYEDDSYFECLMNRFTTPEEILGPISIKQLKEDIYNRKTKGYLPQASFAFLDEIWKSSPAILNTLLTLINERVFRNGEQVENVPLKSLIAASNETPESGQGLEALYDRFLIRLFVLPLKNKKNFNALLQGQNVRAEISIDNELKVSTEEWFLWQTGIDNITLSEETYTIIHLIRKELNVRAEELGVYVSDRRWKSSAKLLKASAFFCGRTQTNHSDTLLLRYCLWSSLENHDSIQNIVDRAIESCGFETEISIKYLDRQKTTLDTAIREELFYGDNTYTTIELNGEKYFSTTVLGEGELPFEIYIPAKSINTDIDITPIDKLGNEYNELKCNFQNQGSCTIQGTVEDTYEDVYDINHIFTPTVITHKGQRRLNTNSSTVDALEESVQEIKAKLQTALQKVEMKTNEQKALLESPFLPSQLTNIAFKGMLQQIEDIKLRIKDCERLTSLIKGATNG